MSQQLLQCSGSLRSYAVCLKHPVLLELTPQCTRAQVHTHTHFLTYFLAHTALCSLILLPLIKKRRCQGAGELRVCVYLSF